MRHDIKPFFKSGALSERRHNNKNRKARPFGRNTLLQNALLLAIILLSLQTVRGYAENIDICSSGGCLATATKAAPAPKKNKGKQAAKSNKPATPKTSPAKQAFKSPAKSSTSRASALKAKTAK